MTAKVIELLDAVDWSPLSHKFQLAAAVLRDDFDLAAELMKRIGPSGEVQKHDYADWPLFREFRKADLFERAYQEVFGDAFVSEITETEEGGNVADC